MHSQRLLLAWALFSGTYTPVERDGQTVTRRPLLLILIMVGVVLDLGISAALYYNNDQISKVANQAAITRLAAYEYCLNSNISKDADLKRWNDIVLLLRNDKHSPDQAAFILGVEKANIAADLKTDCNRIKPPG
jgi:hypothetical protein